MEEGEDPSEGDDEEEDKQYDIDGRASASITPVAQTAKEKSWSMRLQRKAASGKRRKLISRSKTSQSVFSRTSTSQTMRPLPAP